MTAGVFSLHEPYLYEPVEPKCGGCADAIQLSLSEDGSAFGDGESGGGMVFQAPTSLALSADMDHEEYLGQRARILGLTKNDPLYELSPEDRQLIWKARRHIMSVPEALPWFLQVRVAHQSTVALSGFDVADSIFHRMATCGNALFLHLLLSSRAHRCCFVLVDDTLRVVFVCVHMSAECVVG